LNSSTHQSTRTLSLAVLSLSMLAVMAVTALAPALGRIQTSFPQATILQLQMLLNFPALFIIPFSLISGQLTLRFKKRQILFAGLIIFSLSGVASAFVNSFSLFLVLRAFLGIGLGLVTPLSFSLIADLFTGDTRARLMGFSSAVATLSAIGMSLLSGWLAVYNWRYALGAYGIGIFVILLIYFYLPESESKTEEPVKHANLPTLVYAVVLFTIFSIVIFNLISNQMAFFLKSTNLGDSAESGIALASYQGAQFFVALIFDKIYRLFKNNTAIFGLVISVIGFMILFSAHSFWMIVVSVFITGLGIGTLVPFNALTISNQVSSDLSGWALSLNTSAIFAGQFISPFLFSLISDIFNFSSIHFYFLSAAVMCAVVAVIMIIAKIARRKHLSQ
jgi:MFS family permease